MKSGIYRVKPLGTLHRVQQWIRARFGFWYPSPVPIFAKPGKPKLTVRYSLAMILWTIALQASQRAAYELFRIGAVIFNLMGNKKWIKNKSLKGKVNYVLPKPPWTKKQLQAWFDEDPELVAQLVTCAGNKISSNLLKVIGEEKGFAVVELMRPFEDSPPAYKPSTHPWYFARLYETQIGTGDTRRGGLAWGLFSSTGRGYVDKKLLEFVRPF